MTLRSREAIQKSVVQNLGLQMKEEEEARVVVETELDCFEKIAEAVDDKGERDAMVKDLGDISNSDKNETFVIAKTVESNRTTELYNSGVPITFSPTTISLKTSNKLFLDLSKL